MRKRSITLIIWLMSIALIGVMAMQYYFIQQTYQQKSQIFDEAVNASLSSVSSRLERQEVLEFAQEQQKASLEKQLIEQKKQRELAKQLSIQRTIEELRLEQYEYEQIFKMKEDTLKATYPNILNIDNWFYETYIRRPRFRKFIQVNIREVLNEENLVDNYFELFATESIPRVDSKDDSTRYLILDIDPYFKQLRNFKVKVLPPRYNADVAYKIHDLETKLALSMSQTFMDTIGSLGGKRSDFMESISSGMELSKRPLRERINIQLLKKELKEELQRRDINAPFNLEIRDPKRVIYSISNENLKKPINRNKVNTYSTRLFKGDLGSTPGKLTIFFPNKGGVITGNMSYLFLPIITLLILLIGSFIYTLSIIFKQKKISEMKTDFINNMTHEFKTPLATIMIASESLRDEEIASERTRVKRLANIIYDENVRLGNHIERVLNIAKLEKENIKIECNKVSVNSLIKDVLESMQLQLQKAGVELQKNLKADNDIVLGDELHLSNVLLNLVDNAIKYKNNNPTIHIATRESPDKIIITVRDNGIGMTKEQSTRIFDQFYRIPTGNIHNVKGFGLGLSYVYDIIKKLNGKIHVKSEKNKGTQFDIWLPLA